MPNLGMSELVLILVIALVLFGPSKLPEMGKTLGRAMNEFRRASMNSIQEFDDIAKEVKEVKEDVKQATNIAQVTNIVQGKPH